MHTRFDSTTSSGAPHLAEQTQRFSSAHRLFTPTTLSIALSVLLFVSALIPRIILARQLDIVTDEVVYISAGKAYLPLIKHLITSLGAVQWQLNYEHPPLVKVLIGLAIALNKTFGLPIGELLAARTPSIISGSLLITAIYCLGRAPFGNLVAFLAALCLAVSPWLVYFSALAYLDMTMTTFVTIAYLLQWHAIRRPWLYPLSGILIGLGIASKYTAALAVPGIVAFNAYYLFCLWPRTPRAQRFPLPWRWWLITILIAPITFLLADPTIWPDPIDLLRHSFDFEWLHSLNGHLTFLAGQYSLHVPQWAIIYIVITKISAFVTLPAAFFVIFALIQLARFHLKRSKLSVEEATTLAFLLIWLLAILGMFSLLNIVVGTHYHLPIAPSVALAGAYGLTVLLRYRRGQLAIFPLRQNRLYTSSITPLRDNPAKWLKQTQLRTLLVTFLLTITLIGPHLLGLITIRGAEGYTSEFFHGEDSALQVAYPDYRDALQWLAIHTKGHPYIGLAALPDTLPGDGDDVSWYNYNKDFNTRFHLKEVHPTDNTFSSDYIIWPMHLIQRGYNIPAPWSSHIVYTVMGGQTVYCYITARIPPHPTSKGLQKQQTPTTNLAHSASPTPLSSVIKDASGQRHWFTLTQGQIVLERAIQASWQLQLSKGAIKD